MVEKSRIWQKCVQEDCAPIVLLTTDTNAKPFVFALNVGSKYLGLIFIDSFIFLEPANITFIDTGLVFIQFGS